MVKIKYLKYASVMVGGSWRNFDVGFSIANGWITLNLGFIYLSVEW